MFDATGLSTHPVDVGIRSEGAVLGELSKMGYDVLSPFSYNHRYDFVLDLGDRFVKAQCKTGRRRGGAIIFNRVSTRCSQTSVHRRYYSGEIDLFLIYFPPLDSVYAIPIEDVMAGLSSLRVETPKNGRRKGIWWADDYVIGSGERALVALPPAPRLRLTAVPE